MRGAAPKAIQELVGHSRITTTLGYMHLAPSALTEATGLLNFGQPVGSATLHGLTDVLQPVGIPCGARRSFGAAALLGTSRADPSETAACCESLSEVGQTVRTLERCSLPSVAIYPLGREGSNSSK
jgi:hypothetical protein